MQAGGDLPRRALEALAAEEYKHGRLTKPDLRRLLGFETGHQIDDFLKDHEVFDNYSLEYLELEREGLRRFGLLMRVVIADTSFTTMRRILEPRGRPARC